MENRIGAKLKVIPITLEKSESGGTVRMGNETRPDLMEQVPSGVAASRRYNPGKKGKLDLAVLDTLTQQLDALAILKAREAKGKNPVINLFGRLCTGKGTVSSKIIERIYGAPKNEEEKKAHERHILSGGAVMRQLAKTRGYASIEEFVPHITKRDDLELDFSLLLGVMRGSYSREGEETRVDIYEGRLAGLIGHEVKQLGREDVLVVQLDCSPREQILRYINREIGKSCPDIRAKVEPYLADLGSDATRDAVRQAIEAVSDPVLKQLLTPVVTNYDDIVKRDDRDRERYEKTYGRDILDARYYEVVIMTDGKSIDQIVDEIFAHLPAGGCGH